MASPQPLSQNFSVTPLSSTIGAELSGIDLALPLSAERRDELYAALLKWKVIFFRDQDLSVDAHLALGRQFGALEVHPFVAANDEGNPEVLRIRHDDAHPGTENVWHSDVTWRLEPSLGSILRLREAPPVGGDTLFADMAAAYRGLPEAIREQVEGLSARHDFDGFRRRMKERGVPQAELEGFDAKYPNPEHPVVRTHPDTGEQALYVNRAFTRQILGVSESKSRELLEILYQQAGHPEYQCRFRWTANAIAFWDNRACQHYAVSDYWPNRRVAERVTIAGDKPFYRASEAAAPEIGPQYRGVLRRMSTGKVDGPGIQLGGAPSK